jgi:RimJ/RimL family protein N-acetyltransferase
MRNKLSTKRLLLRRWQPSDLSLFAAMNADPEVMEHFPARLTAAESDALVAKFEQHFEQYGFGLWAVEVPGIAPFIGFIGLAHVGFEAEFTPAVEIGWRLARAYWGKGYATEGAKAVLDYGMNKAGLREIVSFTAQSNMRSQKVMQRIGMEYSGTFKHPRLPEGHPLQGHVLYRVLRLPEDQ